VPIHYDPGARSSMAHLVPLSGANLMTLFPDRSASQKKNAQIGRSRRWAMN